MHKLLNQSIRFLAISAFIMHITPSIGFADQNQMMKDGVMKKEGIMKDEMTKKEGIMKDEMMKKEGMMKDGMMKKEGMMKDGMMKIGMSRYEPIMYRYSVSIRITRRNMS